MQQPYNLGPVNTPGYDSHFQTHTKHIANIADHEARVAALEDNPGGVTSVNGQDGAVVLDADDIAETTARKLMTSAERTKLGGIATAATANATDAALRARSSHTGTQLASTISDLQEAVQDIVGAFFTGGGATTVTYDDASNTITVTSTGGSTDPEVVRDAIGAAMVGVGLISVVINDAGDTITISTTATANSSDSSLRDRQTHTGQQAANTISDLTEAVQDLVGAMVTAAGGTYNDTNGTITFPDPPANTNLSYSPQQPLSPSGGTLSTNANAGQNFLVPPLTSAITIANPTNLVAGMDLKWRFDQGGGGSFAGFGSMFKFPYGITPAMSSPLGTKEMLTAYYDGTDLIAVYSQGH